MPSSDPDLRRWFAMACASWLGAGLLAWWMAPPVSLADPVLTRHLPLLAGLMTATLATGRDRFAFAAAAAIPVLGLLAPMAGLHPVPLAAAIAGAAAGPPDRAGRLQAGLVSSGAASAALATGETWVALVAASAGLGWTAWRRADPDLPTWWSHRRLRGDAQEAWTLYRRIRGRLGDAVLRRELHALAAQISGQTSRQSIIQREIGELRAVAVRASTARPGSLHALQLDAHRVRAEEHIRLLEEESERSAKAIREGLALLEEAHAAASVSAVLGPSTSSGDGSLLRRVRALGEENVARARAG